MKSMSTDFDIFACGSVQLDIHGHPSGEPVGAKRPAQIALKAGGCPINIARALAPAGLRTGVFGVQARAFQPWIADEVALLGAVPLICPREDVLGASLVLPGGTTGGRQLWVQRASLRLADFDRTIHSIIRKARVVVVGPIANTDDEALTILALAGSLAQCSVLIPHPNLVRHPRFATLARLFTCVILNSSEAALLTPNREGIEIPALRLRHIIGGNADCIVTNGIGRGLLWAERKWHDVLPHAVECASDVGAGDTFAAHYVAGRFVRGLSPAEALSQAISAVAEFLRGGKKAAVALPRRNQFVRKSGTAGSLFPSLPMPAPI